MSQKGFWWFIRSSLACICILAFLGSCKKDRGGEGVAKSYDFMINVHNRSDTTIVFNDSETYRISNVILGEGRCDHLDCSTCPGQSGSCDGMTYIYNKDNEMISLHSNAGGCRVDLSDDFTMIDLEHEVNPRFHFQIGLFKISPYPTNYANVDLNTYVSTYRIKK